jgi:hypothetical protein
MKKAMVNKRVLGSSVLSEALIFMVIVVENGWAGPVLMALYPEVIVGLARQGAVSIVALQHSLRKNNTCRNAILLHVPDSYTGIPVNII